MRVVSIKPVLVSFVFIVAAVAGGYAIQEESGACLPDHNRAEVENKKFCHCMAMGGVELCHDNKAYSYQEWLEENNKRGNDVDPKTKKQRKPNIPQCAMSCKEDQCECCQFFWDRYHKKSSLPKITIPYDPL